jgi:hypothetical protein
MSAVEKDYVAVGDGRFINTNKKELELYKMNRARAYKEREMQEKIDKLEREIIQIKQILQKHIVGTR